jgi:5'-deoxynucleotidase YfbR-like HD superfamily hydrolase
MKTSLDFYLAGADVKRFHTVATLIPETVGHHSHGVACIVLLLEPSARRELLIAALLHDLSEHQTGDIPSPAKREYGIGEQVSELEERLLNESGWVNPKLNKFEARTLKLADIAHGALTCLKEISLGNSRLRLVFDRYISYANQMLLTGKEKELFNLIEEMSK